MPQIGMHYALVSGEIIADSVAFGGSANAVLHLLAIAHGAASS
jgi:dihydroxyacid dehydratase/phosphogluconate dehydratase